jgi:ESS family glutamate:Na+ symporter
MTISNGIIGLDTLSSLLTACLVLLVGTGAVARSSLLTRYSLPSPVVGGIIFALAAAVFWRVSAHRFAMANTVKADLLLIFFACLGLTADLFQLRQGGPRLLKFLVILVPFLLAQDALGVLVAKLLGLHPFLGLVAGSITLVGGHGTGAAYAEKFGEASAIEGVMTLTMTSATLGLVLGGVIGGPVAERLITRYGLIARSESVADSSVISGPGEAPVTTGAVIGSLSAALIAVLIGRGLATFFINAPVTVPDFLLCLLAGLALRNMGGLFGLRLHHASCDLIGSVCLSIFLAWTMMALDLGSLFAMVGPLLIILAAQATLVALWAYFVAFPALGRDYESAVMTAAFCGFAMGATATAIANMQALTQRHGSAPQAFLIVPLVGAFFIDIINAVVLTLFLSLDMMGLR